MARKSSLEGRLMAVLSEKLNRNGVTRALAIVALILGAAIALPVAMLREADEGRLKIRIEGNIHLVDAEKTKAAEQNVDKRKVALKYTSDAPCTLILDGKEYDLHTKGSVFILRDQGDIEQLDKTMPLRDKADLEKLGTITEHTRFSDPKAPAR